jgi:hypothetical protein
MAMKAPKAVATETRARADPPAEIPVVRVNGIRAENKGANPGARKRFFKQDGSFLDHRFGDGARNDGRVGFDGAMVFHCLPSGLAPGDASAACSTSLTICVWRALSEGLAATSRLGFLESEFAGFKVFLDLLTAEPSPFQALGDCTGCIRPCEGVVN